MDQLSDNELDKLLYQLNYAMHALDTMHWVHDDRIERAYDEIVYVKGEADDEQIRRLSREAR